MSNAMTVVTSWSSEYVTEVFLKPVFMAENIIDTYAVDPTVNRSKKLNLAEDLRQIIQKRTDCEFVASTTGFDIVEKTITTEACTVNLEQCALAFYDTVFKQNLKRGTDVYDLSATVMEQVMVDRVSTAIANDIFELCWFGDTSLTSTFYEPFDGWFKLFASASNTVDIGTTAGFTTGDGVAALKDMYVASNALRAVQPKDKVFLVTDSVYFDLLEAYEDNSLDSGLARMAEGGPLTFRGIAVEPQLAWDSTIAAESLSDPHRIVYTKKENLLIGTDIRRPGTDAKLFLDEVNDKFLFKANFDLGVQYLFDEYLVYATGV